VDSPVSVATAGSQVKYARQAVSSAALALHPLHIQFQIIMENAAADTNASMATAWNANNAARKVSHAATELQQIPIFPPPTSTAAVTLSA
jgi:hypothetical protein